MYRLQYNTILKAIRARVGFGSGTETSTESAIVLCRIDCLWYNFSKIKFCHSTDISVCDKTVIMKLADK